jgi:hypothetical protein
VNEKTKLLDVRLDDRIVNPSRSHFFLLHANISLCEEKKKKTERERENEGWIN